MRTSIGAPIAGQNGIRKVFEKISSMFGQADVKRELPAVIAVVLSVAVIYALASGYSIDLSGECGDFRGRLTINKAAI